MSRRGRSHIRRNGLGKGLSQPNGPVLHMALSVDSDTDPARDVPVSSARRHARPMATISPRTVHSVCALLGGLASARELAAHGIGRAAIAHALRSGTIERARRGV
ncbi:hypothetical protein DCE93_05625 [Agromyces badenianii]|uniref:AbiEi antitoxin N-terminal domain-containing protein n=1 Tax=Agromyces badenianii TaxID=2080742 RepID=A0A2S0WV77_9MICO|nr:hypothetical protein DCE93_05625 [Agromyces badenianii]